MEKDKQNENLISRPPVVVVLGHVDHGKSTLIERIKEIKITEKETGGITQHIGAYEIEKGGKKITFIDTPGHEAFSAMRSRGAKVADLAILVIDATEGVKEQTKEAITFIEKSGIPMIVALNKMDKPTANPEKVKRELAPNNILVESMGGKIPSVEISAKTGQNIEELLEIILLVGEMEKLEGDFKKPAGGVIIEAYLNGQRGPVATLLLNNGVLKLGDIIATASTLGKIKILEDFQGKPISQAFPSMPAVVLGFMAVPQVGEKFKIFPNIELAQEYLKKKERKREKAPLFFITPEKKVLNLILKADVAGSLEAVSDLLQNLPQEKVILRILKKEVGDISESDIKLAKSAKAKILGFRVKVNPIAQQLSEREEIRVMNFGVIYELSQGVRQLMEKTLAPQAVRTDLGKVKVLVIFRTEKNRQIIGGKVIEGEVKRGVLIEVFRDEEKIGQGKLVNLQRNKKDTDLCPKGDECGILFEGNFRIEEGDTLLIYAEERKKGEL
jgi:translation initiation factor IF-2